MIPTNPWSGESLAPTAPPLRIYVGATYIKFQATRNGYVGDNIHKLSLVDFVKRNLQETEYIPRFHSTIVTYKYSLYNQEEGMVYMPRHCLDKLLIYLGSLPYELVPLDPPEPNKFKASMKKDFVLRDHQVPIVNFLTSGKSFTPLSSFTGSGKTLSSIAATVQIGETALIILSMLISQWFKSIRQFTNISKDDIYVVQGFDSLRTLWEMGKNGFRPKIIIFSTRTLALYCIRPESPYSELQSYQEFQKEFGIGIKIVDECHMNFNTNALIDLCTNVRHNIYLSATYQRSNPQGRRIFDMVFPKELRYGEQFAKKYCNVFLVRYHLGIPSGLVHKFATQKGYNHSRYETFLMKHTKYSDYFCKGTLIPMIRDHYLTIKKSGQRCLILCSTREFAKFLYDNIKSAVGKCSIAVYFSGDSSKEGNDKNLTKDIIVSTIKSCGTGRDIAGLKCCINTVSFSSPPLTTQMMGRLREIPGDHVFYIDLWNGEVGSHFRHSRERLNIYKQKAAAVAEINHN